MKTLPGVGISNALDGSHDDLVCDKVPIVDASSTDAPDHDDEDDTEDEIASFPGAEEGEKNVRTRSPRNSVAIKHMRKQRVPGALSPPPPLHLGTKLKMKMLM